MFGNYFKIALRNLKRYKGYSFINISGLAIGMACCILILLWVQDELSFDIFHKNAGDLYLTAAHMRINNTDKNWQDCPPAVGPALKAEYPEILDSVRTSSLLSVTLSYNNKKFEEQIFLSDPSLLEMFSFPLVYGDPSTVLLNPYSILLTERAAEKYFGSDNPVCSFNYTDNQNDGYLQTVELYKK